MIRLPALSEAAAEGWRTLFQLSERHPDAWTLIGAQMVAAHAYEHGVEPPRTSLDFDVLADVRMASTGSTESLARTLASLGFKLDEPSPGGLSHRFRRAAVVIDLLAPDGLSPRTPERPFRPLTR